MSNIIDFISNYSAFVFIIIIIIIFFGVIKLAIKSNKKIKELKETQIPRRFKYLDTFYFTYSDGEDSHTVAFNIIEELGSKKTYAMPYNEFEKCVFIAYRNPRLVMGKGLVSKMPKVEFNQEGNFWVSEELDGLYSNDNNVINLTLKTWVFKKSFTVVYDKKNNPDKLELKRYCSKCRKHVVAKEKK